MQDVGTPALAQWAGAAGSHVLPGPKAAGLLLEPAHCDRPPVQFSHQGVENTGQLTCNHEEEGAGGEAGPERK